MAVAKDRAKDKMMEKAGALMSGDTAHNGAAQWNLHGYG